MNDEYQVFTHTGSKLTGLNLIEIIREYQNLGVGEIVINSISHDGIMNGYDFVLIDYIKDRVNVPLTILGGAGSHDDIGMLISKYGLIGASAGSLFVFKGVYKAVLINYPNLIEKGNIISRYYETQTTQ